MYKAERLKYDKTKRDLRDELKAHILEVKNGNDEHAKSLHQVAIGWWSELNKFDNQNDNDNYEEEKQPIDLEEQFRTELSSVKGLLPVREKHLIYVGGKAPVDKSQNVEAPIEEGMFAIVKHNYGQFPEQPFYVGKVAEVYQSSDPTISDTVKMIWYGAKFITNSKEWMEWQKKINQARLYNLDLYNKFAPHRKDLNTTESDSDDEPLQRRKSKKKKQKKRSAEVDSKIVTTNALTAKDLMGLPIEVLNQFRPSVELNEAMNWEYMVQRDFPNTQENLDNFICWGKREQVFTKAGNLTAGVKITHTFFQKIIESMERVRIADLSGVSVQKPFICAPGIRRKTKSTSRLTQQSKDDAENRMSFVESDTNDDQSSTDENKIESTSSGSEESNDFESDSDDQILTKSSVIQNNNCTSSSSSSNNNRRHHGGSIAGTTTNQKNNHSNSSSSSQNSSRSGRRGTQSAAPTKVTKNTSTRDRTSAGK